MRKTVDRRFEDFKTHPVHFLRVTADPVSTSRSTSTLPLISFRAQFAEAGATAAADYGARRGDGPIYFPYDWKGFRIFGIDGRSTRPSASKMPERRGTSTPSLIHVRHQGPLRHQVKPFRTAQGPILVPFLIDLCRGPMDRARTRCRCSGRRRAGLLVTTEADYKPSSIATLIG